jgi:Protein of unknown function (DUF732)
VSADPTRRRRLWPWLVASAALVGFAVLGNSGSEQAVPDSVTATSPDSVFLATLRGQGIGVRDETATIRAGRLMCDAIASGATPQAIALETAKSVPVSLEQAGFTVGAAISTFCPRYRSQIGR